MGVVLAFPAHKLRPAIARAEPARIVILPVIRYERHGVVTSKGQSGKRPGGSSVKRRSRKA